MMLDENFAEQEAREEYEVPRCSHCNEPIMQGEEYWEDANGDTYCVECKNEYLDATYFQNDNDTGFFTNDGDYVSVGDGYFYNDNPNLEKECIYTDDYEFLQNTKLIMDYESYWEDHDY